MDVPAGREDATTARELAVDCLDAAIEAARPRPVVREEVAVDGTTLTVGDATYDLAAYDAVTVVGGGNAAGGVAAELESVLGDHLADGVVVTDEPADADAVRMVRGDHPVPTERNVAGAASVLELARDAGADTLVVGVVTGGASALLAAPDGDVTLADLQGVTEDLLASGADVHEINAVRKHLSRVKGGRLARRVAPADCVAVLVSDVVGDDRSVIGSGPFEPDETTFADAVDVLERYGVDAPATVEGHLQSGAGGDRPETPDDPERFDHVDAHVLVDNVTALRAAADVAEAAGYAPMILSSRMRGEARELGRAHVAVAEEVRATGNPVDPPAVFLSGGEATVAVTGDGTGGPNQEFALGAALELTDPGVVVASVDSDGIDGDSDAAGALVDAGTVGDADDERAARDALADNDAHTYLRARGCLLETGPTGTNVSDVRVVVVE